MNELVYLKNDEAVCRSVDVAKMFGKRHDKLIHEIERMYSDLIGNSNVRNGGAKFFHKSSYESRGKHYPMYLMNRDGFSLLVMGFTGKEALEWKLKYIEAFNYMEFILREKSTGAWLGTREQGKLTRKAEADTIKQLVEYAKSQGSTHADRLYSNYTNLANKIAGIKDREEATTVQLNNLTLIENIILNCIQNGIIAEKHYKEIYQDCKRRLEVFKDIVYLETAS
ncbi:MAG: Rha family transcriptional regulator [Firmicutes bacterium]|nr:Rha family transcriptional regulator [Bacillota bacterium]